MGFPYFKRLLKKSKVKLARISNSRFGGKMDKDTAMMYAIVRAMSKHPKTKFLTAPISQTYYLENKELEYFIVVDYDNIRITNHKFFASKHINSNDGDKIISYIKTHIEAIRKDMEAEIFKNQSALYKNIYDSLKEQSK
jgi:hypothetical protein